MTPQAMEALEVYHGFELPVEFGVNTCGGILLWTRRGVTPVPPADEEEAEGDDGSTSLLGRLIQVTMVVREMPKTAPGAADD